MKKYIGNHCVKYATLRFFSDPHFPAQEHWEYTRHRKPAFWHILHSQLHSIQNQAKGG